MDQTEKNKSKPWMKYVLIGSLGVNLLVAGLFVGAVVGGGKHGYDRMSPNIGLGMMQFVKPLPEVERKALFREFRKLRPQRKQAFETINSQNQEILTVIRAEPFDADALMVAFETQHGLVAGVLSKGRNSLVEVVSKMSAEDRQIYATAVEAELKKRPSRRKDRSKRRSD